ncbi:polysaccharide ABC transporter ATP-binding protein [Flavobacterium okayamense]|uniref:ABC transporter ATP-binding protein n=1 Tax=Flavobacterium okayamense TaxID=2830782 RepID=A0ABM7S0G2_9FLAO|nr:ABC transporter ATP-binding protein [Flavobacterium okayamense]BCY27258.1 ABC transporter ATP-binding protein [Flavobacterium okayamense]
MGEVLIKAENVSKKFAKDFKKSLYYGLVDVFSSVFRKKQNKGLRKDEFWAVQNISFEVRRGECLGLIGHNGAGKSTLLKILNGLIAPDEGSITMYGKVGALIELGAGFNPILSGRENIYNNAAIIGFTKNEIDAKLQDIIDFAEIEEFIDMPVQNYSSGMKVRLGFAVAAQMEPDVLIVDEVLAVGDLGFILKCFKQIDTILPNTAVIFVSHNMPMVSRICNEIILMDHGKVEYQGSEVSKGINLYYKKFSNSSFNVVFDDKRIEFISCKLINIKNTESDHFNWLEDMIIELEFKNKALHKIPFVNLSIFDKEQRGIGVITADLNDDFIEVNQFFKVKITYKQLQFSKGRYSLNLNVSESENINPVLRINTIAEFTVNDSCEIWSPFKLKTETNYVK